MIRLPLHYWAEQIERIVVNRKIYPECVALKNEHTYYIGKLLDEVKSLNKEFRDSLTDKAGVALKSVADHHQVPRNN